MIFEQSFMALPEFLTGTPFQRYRYEGTVLTAFSMAVLQELNSRNINNPISLLRSEVDYSDEKIAFNTRKRADLCVSIKNLMVLNEKLESYGYYETNWLEAKFCRLGSSNKPVVSALTNTFLALKDIIRLCVFPVDNINNNDKSLAGRYFLHAYQGDWKQYYQTTRNEHGRRQERKWINSLLSMGKHQIIIDDLAREKSKEFKKQIGDCKFNMNLDVSLTNLVHESYDKNNCYYIVLSRIDNFEIKIKDEQGILVTLKRDNGKFKISPPNKTLGDIKNQVDKWLNN